MLSMLSVLKCTRNVGDISRKYVATSLRQNLWLTNIEKSSSRLNSKYFLVKNFCHNQTRFAKTGPKRGRGLLPSETVEGTRKSFKSLLKPFLFTITVSCISYSAAAIWQYEELKKVLDKTSSWNFDEEFNSGSLFYNKAGSIRQRINHWWNQLRSGEKVVVTIIALNSAVFLLWRIPNLQSFMMTYFTASPMGSAPCLSMLLSTFSHYSFFHLFANMYVLWSFTPSVTNLLGPEQFTATYLTAAVISSFGSYVIKMAQGSMLPSLGASGAIMAILGMVCMKHPEARLSIAFVDQIFPHSFASGDVMKGLIVMDTLGILLRWTLFDHGAHLAGMFFGLWYVSYGHKMILRKRELVIKKWHSIRDRPSGD